MRRVRSKGESNVAQRSKPQIHSQKCITAFATVVLCSTALLTAPALVNLSPKNANRCPWGSDHTSTSPPIRGSCFPFSLNYFWIVYPHVLGEDSCERHTWLYYWRQCPFPNPLVVLISTRVKLILQRPIVKGTSEMKVWKEQTDCLG